MVDLEAYRARVLEQPELTSLNAFLARAAQEIRLLDRVRPCYLNDEMQRVWASFSRGEPTTPKPLERRPAQLQHVRGALEQLSIRLDGLADWRNFYLEKIEELALEATIAEQLGRVEVRELIARRFPEDLSGPGQVASGWAGEWLSAPPTPELAFRTDDEGEPRSLISLLRKEIYRLKLGLQVLLKPELQSRVAVTDQGIYLKPGQLLSLDAARGLVEHELKGHVLPRQAGKKQGGVLGVGSARGGDDQEGFAVLCEQRAGLLNSARKFELALRHEAARRVRRGAEFVDIARFALGQGAELSLALPLAERAVRGDGLGRELVYLQGLARVTEAFEAEPRLEGWFRAGTLSVEAAFSLNKIFS